MTCATIAGGLAAIAPVTVAAATTSCANPPLNLAGWWPGDERVSYPAFYAYASPKPAGIEHATIAPAGAAWSETSGLFILPYDAVRAGADPPRAILDFLSSTYSVAAGLLRWNTDLTHVVAPTQGQ